MKKTILVVDDELAILKYAELRLRSRGYAVITARDGDQAIERARAYLPDLILLDIRLPRKSGFEVCRHIREEPATSRIPIIFWTAHATGEIESRTHELKADDFLLKPFEADELFEKVARYTAEGNGLPPDEEK